MAPVFHTLFSKAIVPPNARLQPSVKTSDRPTEVREDASAPMSTEGQAVELPRMPSELTLDIMLLALPHLQFDSFTHRSLILRRFSLVNQEWRALAQALLFTHPCLPTPDAAAQFISIVSSPDPRQLGRATRSLRLGVGMRVQSRTDGQWSNAAPVIDLVRCCPDVEELWMNGVDNFQLVYLSDATKLQTLYIFNGSIAERWHLAPVPAPIATIRRLSLRGAAFVGGDPTALAFAQSMPGVDTLAVYNDAPRVVLDTLMPQLRSLSVNLDGAAPVSFDARASRLRCLFVRGWTVHANTTSFPPALHCLHIGKFTDRASQLRFLDVVMAALPESLATLSSVRLPRYFTKQRRVDDDGRGPEEDRATVYAVDRLRVVCAPKIRLLDDQVQAGGDILVQREFFGSRCLLSMDPN